MFAKFVNRMIIMTGWDAANVDYSSMQAALDWSFQKHVALHSSIVHSA